MVDDALLKQRLRERDVLTVKIRHLKVPLYVEIDRERHGNLWVREVGTNALCFISADKHRTEAFILGYYRRMLGGK